MDSLKELVSEREEQKPSILSKEDSATINIDIAQSIAKDIKSLRGFESLTYNEIEDALDRYDDPIKSIVLDILFRG